MPIKYTFHVNSFIFGGHYQSFFRIIRICNNYVLILKLPLRITIAYKCYLPNKLSKAAFFISTVSSTFTISITIIMHFARYVTADVKGTVF